MDTTQKHETQVSDGVANRSIHSSSEFIYHTLIDDMSEGIVIIDANGQLIFANPAMRRLIGYSTQEMTNQDLLQYLHTDSHVALRRMLAARMPARLERFEAIWLRKDGSKVCTLFSPQYRRTAEGNADGLFAVITDITEQKNFEAEILRLTENLEAQVSERTASLEELNKELEAFSYSVSHDLRAPLRHIGGYVELFRKKTTHILSEVEDRYLTTITASTKEMGLLIDDLLEFSRTGRAELNKLKLNMADLLQEVIEEYKREHPDRKIDWIVDAMPWVKADYAMMRVVWNNLISNAVKFTRTRKLAKIEIGCHAIPEGWEFYIKDNGVGFDIRYVNKLFGVFQRLHPESEFEGTGIGLANVRRIIAKHGGQTRAESVLEQETTIYFTLPAQA